MPTKIEIYSRGRWRVVGTRLPTDAAGSMVNVTSDQKQQLYVILCSKDDSHTWIYRSRLGFDMAKRKKPIKIDTTVFEPVIRLSSGQCYNMTLRADTAQTYAVRFSHHVTEDQ